MILPVFITLITGHDKPQPPGCLLGFRSFSFHWPSNPRVKSTVFLTVSLMAYTTSYSNRCFTGLNSGNRSTKTPPNHERFGCQTAIDSDDILRSSTIITSGNIFNLSMLSIFNSFYELFFDFCLKKHRVTKNATPM